MQEQKFVDKFCEYAWSLGHIILGREVNLGIGIADIISWRIEDERLCIIEFKAETANSSTCAQVFLYCRALNSWINDNYYGIFEGPYKDSLQIQPVIIAPKIKGFSKRAWLSGLIDYYEIKENPIAFVYQESLYPLNPYTTNSAVIDENQLHAIVHPLKMVAIDIVKNSESLIYKGGHRSNCNEVFERMV